MPIQTANSLSPRFSPKWPTLCAVFCAALGLAGCQTPAARLAPLTALDRPVDLERFLGDWYVVAHIPVFIENKAYDAVESYALKPDGSIATTYTFRHGGHDGPLRTYRPVGFVRDRTNRAEWGMQFIWPFRATYLIAYLDPHYEATVIGVPNRRYVWVMTRSPHPSPEVLEPALAFVAESGHDLSRLRRVPQATKPLSN